MIPYLHIYLTQIKWLGQRTLLTYHQSLTMEEILITSRLTYNWNKYGNRNRTAEYKTDGKSQCCYMAMSFCNLLWLTIFLMVPILVFFKGQWSLIFAKPQLNALRITIIDFCTRKEIILEGYPSSIKENSFFSVLDPNQNLYKIEMNRLFVIGGKQTGESSMEDICSTQMTQSLLSKVEVIYNNDETLDQTDLTTVTGYYKTKYSQYNGNTMVIEVPNKIKTGGFNGLEPKLMNLTNATINLKTSNVEGKPIEIICQIHPYVKTSLRVILNLV